MEDQEIRERYGLKGKRHAVILLVTMVLLILSIVIDAILIAEYDYKATWLNGIVAIGCSLLLVIYAVWGYKLSVISFQIVVAVRAVLTLIGFIGCIYYKTGLFPTVMRCITLVLLLVFLLTMKNNQTVAKASIIVICILSLYPFMPLLITTGQFAIRTIPHIVVNSAIAIIYFSRIARKEVRESKEA
jgi:hypothetical protein